jgi:uncharacterized protein (DUF927 family)
MPTSKCSGYTISLDQVHLTKVGLTSSSIERHWDILLGLINELVTLEYKLIGTTFFICNFSSYGQFSQNEVLSQSEECLNSINLNHMQFLRNVTSSSMV